MRESIIELKYTYQVQDGELSVFNKIELTELTEQIGKIENEIKKMVSPEVFEKVNELINLHSEDSAIWAEKTYEVGFKDGIKVLKEIKALN